MHQPNRLEVEKDGWVDKTWTRNNDAYLEINTSSIPCHARIIDELSRMSLAMTVTMNVE